MGYFDSVGLLENVGHLENAEKNNLSDALNTDRSRRHVGHFVIVRSGAYEAESHIDSDHRCPERGGNADVAHSEAGGLQEEEKRVEHAANDGAA